MSYICLYPCLQGTLVAAERLYYVLCIMIINAPTLRQAFKLSLIFSNAFLYVFQLCVARKRDNGILSFLTFTRRKYDFVLFYASYFEKIPDRIAPVF